MNTETNITITHRARPVGVQARKIIAILGAMSGGGRLVKLDDHSTYSLDPAMTARVFPTVGDYLIVGQDGYAYINPSDVFERKYEPLYDPILDEARFQRGDVVLFQPRVELLDTENEYDNAVPARVERPRLVGGVLYYDIALRYEDHGEVRWTPIDGVNNMMLLPMRDLVSKLDDTGTDKKGQRELRIWAIERAIVAACGDDVVPLAREIEAYIAGSNSAIALANLSAIKVDPTATALTDLAPNDGPRVTPELLNKHVEQVYYFTARQATLALGADDHPDLDRATFCLMVLRSGALVIGTSIVASRENVDENTGRQQAHRDAVNRLSEFLGFAMNHGGKA